MQNFADQEQNTAAIFKEIRAMSESMMKKLEKLVAENSGRMEKQQTHKHLTLMLSPLIECFKLSGRDE